MKSKAPRRKSMEEIKEQQNESKLDETVKSCQKSSSERPQKSNFDSNVFPANFNAVPEDSQEHKQPDINKTLNFEDNHDSESEEEIF